MQGAINSEKQPGGLPTIHHQSGRGKRESLFLFCTQKLGLSPTTEYDVDPVVCHTRSFRPTKLQRTGLRPVTHTHPGTEGSSWKVSVEGAVQDKARRGRTD